MKQDNNIFEQGLLRYLRPEQLCAVQAVRVGIGGAGGLGSNVAAVLVRSGFRDLEIVDHGFVEPSDLNRQFYTSAQAGHPKLDALRDNLLAINAELRLKLWRETWCSENAGRYFSACDFVVEAFDDPDCKHRFLEYYQDKVKIMVSGNGMAGISLGPHLNVQRLGNVFIVGDGQTAISSQIAPFAPRVIACAALMAGVILEQTLARAPKAS